MREAKAGGAILPGAEATRRPRVQAASPTAAAVSGTAGAPTSSAGAVAVPRPPAAEADLVVAITVHPTSGPTEGGVEAKLSAGVSSERRPVGRTSTCVRSAPGAYECDDFQSSPIYSTLAFFESDKSFDAIS